MESEMKKPTNGFISIFGESKRVTITAVRHSIMKAIFTIKTPVKMLESLELLVSDEDIAKLLEIVNCQDLVKEIRPIYRHTGGLITPFKPRVIVRGGDEVVFMVPEFFNIMITIPRPSYIHILVNDLGA